MIESALPTWEQDVEVGYEAMRRRLKLLGRHVSCPVEMLAGPDDLTADRGIILGKYGASGSDEPTVLVDFEKNGRWRVPISLLFIPETDSIRRLTDAFILFGPQPRERELMSISFQLACKPNADRHQQYDAMHAGVETVVGRCNA